MVYHLVEKYRDSGHSRVVLSSNLSQVAIDAANHRSGRIPDTDFIVGKHPDWMPEPEQITPLTSTALTG